MTIRLEIDRESDLPLYEQIAASFRRAISTGAMRPGDRLPTVREIAQETGVNINTVARAFLALAGERLIETRRGAGSVVHSEAPDRLRGARRAELTTLADDFVRRGVALGFTPDELEAAVTQQFLRWRAMEPSSQASDAPPGETVRFAGSHDLSLELLFRRLAGHRPPIHVDARFCGSLDGLIALARGEADLAGCHLIDAESGTFNLPYVRRLLPARPVTVITLAERRQGLLVATGNPLGIRGVEDLVAPGIRLANRQIGSGTRVLLDLLLRRQGLNGSMITGYDREYPTHHAVAAAVHRGEADVGLGIEAASSAYGLDFIALTVEPYQLVVPEDRRGRPDIETLLATCRDRDFQRLIAGLGGYDLRAAGKEVHVV